MIPDEFWSKIKNVQRIHQRLYDSGKGWIVGWLILLLRHTGRKSGKLYATPLQYEKIGATYCIGAARGSSADWFRNVQANPNVDVSVGRQRFKALAEAVTDPEKVADFLAFRLKHRPLMIGLMMKMHKLPMKPSREQLLVLGQTTALVILHPLQSDSL
jgi:deazaflavin-dependent oxidoreductase (nitroreductase family)